MSYGRVRLIKYHIDSQRLFNSEHLSPFNMELVSDILHTIFKTKLYLLLFQEKIYKNAFKKEWLASNIGKRVYHSSESVSLFSSLSVV